METLALLLTHERAIVSDKANDAAQHYLNLGWHPIPLHKKSKRCVDDDWLTRDYSAKQFPPTFNLGLKFIDGLVDVDCDCREAIFLASELLPATEAVYGRKTARASHWLFTSPDTKYKVVHKDYIRLETNKTAKEKEEVVIVELRVNHMSMAPPSTHPNGEAVRWEGKDLPLSAMKVEHNVLARALKLIATGTMMCRYYNPPGARHDWGMALAGYLRRLSLNEHETTKLFELSGQWCKDPDIQDRVNAVRSTYKQDEDSPTTSAKRLKDLIGDQGDNFVKSLARIWGDDATGVSDNKIVELNKRHAVLFRQGGKVTILTETLEGGRRQIRYTNPREFRLLYPSKVQVGVTKMGSAILRSLADSWLEHPKRRFYSGIELAPKCEPNEGYYNLWQGFTVEPKQGDWSRFRQHLSLLVQHDPDNLDYVISWMAETVQNPSEPIGVALTFRGGMGVGKTTAGKWFGGLFGNHFLHLDSDKRLLGHFNAHLHNAVVVLADEAVWAGGKAGLGALKRMITEETLDIEPKGLDVIQVKNMLHMFVASNEDWVVPTAFDDRRFAIFEVSKEKQNNHQWFNAVHKQLFHEGGLAALLYDLLEFKVARNLRSIPDTEERRKQKQHSMNVRQSWWLDQLMSGELWNNKIEGSDDYELTPNDVYSDYVVAITKADKRESPGTIMGLGRFFATMLPLGYPQSVVHSGSRFWVIPSLEVCRQHFDEMTSMAVEWPENLDRPIEDVPF